MNWSSRSLVLALFISIMMNFAGQAVASNKKSTVSPVVYRLLQEAQLPLVDNDENAEKPGENLSVEDKAARSKKALEKLSKLKLSDYEAAIMARLQGNLAISVPAIPNYVQAYEFFQSAWKKESLPSEAQQKLTHLLAQLAFELQQWPEAISYMEAWLKHAENESVPEQSAIKIKPEDYLILAQSHSQLNEWQAVISPVHAALKMRSPAPESWYQLALAAHSQLQQHRDTIEVLKTLITYYPSGEYWQQLATTQHQLQQPRAALASLQTAYVGGYLKDEQHIRWLAQLCLEFNLPNKAATLIQESFNTGNMSRNKTNLTLLANAQISAKSYADALKTMESLTELFPGDTETRTVLEQLRQFNAQKDGS
ncbi:TPR repeat protein [Oleiphilus messinensis]|uniref:TPR repeat protein n=1 Tax=Oleiphilus messinensis TaxID=141451 RepID=A0A1Y0ICL8_9GAMM|nr:hypothetical protein [Oleiphilus messinensis]ARU57879.1 TPR repeat protein [Oleiphilus messinensis]